MAEPTGIFIEFEINEKELQKMLNHKFDKAYNNKLGYYFCELLHDCNVSLGNVLIFNHDISTNKCFIAYLLNQYTPSLLEPFIDVLHLISATKSSNNADYAIVSTTFPDVLQGYKITSEKLEKTNQKLPSEIVNNLMTKFWSFAENNSFADPNIAVKKRNYFYKNFKNYYKKYLLHLEEVEKPNKIKQATKENPCHLFGNFYSYNNKVFDFNDFTSQIIEIPKADPLTFRDVSGIKGDNTLVFIKNLAKNSPPDMIKRGSLYMNNPNALWEWTIVDGVDGSSFNYVKEKWDTIYWKDKNSVFIYKDGELVKLDQADSKTFTHLDFCFGKDKNHIFYLDKIIPVDVNNYQLNKNGFLFDSNTIFHYENKLDLDAKTFKVVAYESEVNPFIGQFILEDKNGRYKYNRAWKGEILVPVAGE